MEEKEESKGEEGKKDMNRNKGGDSSCLRYN